MNPARVSRRADFTVRRAVLVPPRSLIVATLFVLALAALGWHFAIWPLNQHSEAALKRRAQQFWDLKVAGDPEGAYELMADMYRRRVAPAGFVRSISGPVVHLRASVLDVSVNGDHGTVELELNHVFNRPYFRDMTATSRVKDRWVFENGGWYRWPPEG